jgi:hypothetical protein
MNRGIGLLVENEFTDLASLQECLTGEESAAPFRVKPSQMLTFGGRLVFTCVHR